VLSKPTTTLSEPLNYCRKVLLGSVEVRLLEVLKTIANQSGLQLPAARGP
jgi:hypothetical protein